MTEPIDATDELYSLPLEDFTAARDRVVKQLREDGDTQQAAMVARLRKPTTDAWALNQVARRHSDLVRRLIEAHTALRQANEPAAFRSASEARNRVLDELMEAAASILEGANHAASGPVRERISQTLLAAAADSQTEEDLAHGRLVRSVHITGGWDLDLALAPQPDPGQRATDEAGKRREAEQLREVAERTEATATRLRREAEGARQELEAARRRLAAAEEAARGAEKEARQARKEWESARRR